MITRKLESNCIFDNFDCGDDDLNEFLNTDALSYQEKRIATTYVVEHDQKVIAYFSLLNDKISKTDVSKSAWRKLKKLFAHRKHRSNYPAIKIGRLAVTKEYANSGLGSIILTAIKRTADERSTYSAFRFITVDAYLKAIPFYAKNGFIEMVADGETGETRSMYFDTLNYEK